MIKLAFAGALALAFASPAFAMGIRPGEGSMFAPALVGSLILAALCLIVLGAVVRFGVWAPPRLRLRSFAVIAGALAFGAVPLAGCVLTGNPSADLAAFNANVAADVNAFNQQVANNLPAACALDASANAAFQTVVATGTVSSSNVTTVNAWSAAVSALCANPSAVTNPATALMTLANAYAAFIEAKSGGTPPPAPTTTATAS